MAISEKTELDRDDILARYRRVMERRSQGWTLAKIAIGENISRQRVLQIMAKTPGTVGRPRKETESIKAEIAARGGVVTLRRRRAVVRVMCDDVLILANRLPDQSTVVSLLKGNGTRVLTGKDAAFVAALAQWVDVFTNHPDWSKNQTALRESVHSFFP